MKRLFLFATILVCCILLSGCATSSRLSVANSATITQANFHMVRTIEREYTATYFIAIGGGRKAELLKNAINDMSKELQPNQALAYINVVESHMIPLIPIFFTQTTHVSAIIIEYDR